MQYTGWYCTLTQLSFPSVSSGWVRSRSDGHSFAGSSEYAEDLGGFAAGAAKPVRHLGVE
jgi:hypothetical protein